MPDLIWKKFNALGTEVIITALLEKDKERVLEDAERAVFDFEKRFSRFMPDNELQRFNLNDTAKDGPFKASRQMIDLLNDSKRFNAETGGVFDPTIITSLEAVGYNKTFIEIGKSGEKDGKVDIEKISKEFGRRPKIKDLKITGNEVLKPKGLRIDFGGIGKGYIADFLAEKFFSEVDDFWISAGGDLLLKGNGLDSAGWKVGVQNPNEPDKEIFSIKTKGEKMGIATSAVFKRKGDSGGFEWHHIIDPRSGLPAKNNVIAVTAIAPTAEQADIYAKTALILGETDGLKFIETREDTSCVIFLKDKSLLMSKNALNYFS